MRHPDLDSVVDIIESDQATEVGFLDRFRGADPVQRRQLDRLTDGQRIHGVGHRDGQIADTRLDQLDQARRHHRLASPLPVITALLQALVRDRLLDNVPQIQGVALRQIPQAGRRIRLDRSDQCLRQQRRRSLRRQRLQVDPLELSELPKFLYSNGNRLVVPLREQNLGDASLHDLLQHEHRQVIEKVRVVDSDHHRCARRRRGQRFDDLTHQVQTVAAGQSRPRRKGAKRDSPPA